MLGSTRISLTPMWFLALAGCIAGGACSHREASSGTIAKDTLGVEQRTACTGDSLRPAVGAPASGLWLYEPAVPGASVAAMIGPPRSDDRSFVVTRPVESVEVTEAGDTIRYSLAAATASLELLPPHGRGVLGAGSATDSTGATQPAATYAPSPRVRLASYEPFATSVRGPRIRYLRRDAAGRIVTDVMLRRASEQ